MHCHRRLFGQYAVRHMRGQRRKRPPCARHNFGARRRCLIGVYQPIRQGPRQNPVAGIGGPFHRPIRSAIFGRLRNGHQQGRFGRGQPFGFFAKIRQRGRADAFQIAAIRRQMQIQLQNLILGQPPFQRQRHPHLPQLAAHRPGAAFFQQPRHLHRQRRSTRHHVAVPRRLRHGTGQCAHVHPGMIVKPLIFIGQQGGDKSRINLAHLHRQPPPPIGHGIGAQQVTVAVQHLDRGFHDQRR